MKEIQLSQKLERKIDTFFEESQDLEEILVDIQIEDQDDFDNIVDLIEEYKNKVSYLEEERLSVVDPLNKVTKKVNSWFKPTVKTLENCILLLREKIVDYESSRYKERVTAIKKGKPKPRNLGSGKVTYRIDWGYSIENFDEIPIEYLTLDHSKVKIELREKQGDLNIPGIEVIPKKIPIVKR